jgi:hypothetical protein
MNRIAQEADYATDALISDCMLSRCTPLASTTYEIYWFTQKHMTLERGVGIPFPPAPKPHPPARFRINSTNLQNQL